MHSAPAIPGGFRVARISGDFIAFNGPLYARLLDGRVQLGFRVEQRHTNPLGICHGGMFAIFADMLVPCTNMVDTSRERRFLPTISLNIDYLGPSRLGAWVPGYRAKPRCCALRCEPLGSGPAGLMRQNA